MLKFFIFVLMFLLVMFFSFLGSLNLVGLFFMLSFFMLLVDIFLSDDVKLGDLSMSFLDGISWVKNVLFMVFNFLVVCFMCFWSKKINF